LLEWREPGLVSRLLPQYRVAPLVGTEFLLEVVNLEAEPAVSCFLCHFTCDLEGLMYHLLSARHRLAFLVNNFYEVFQQKYNFYFLFRRMPMLTVYIYNSIRLTYFLFCVSFLILKSQLRYLRMGQQTGCYDTLPYVDNYW
jgi:hypothetical protein